MKEAGRKLQSAGSNKVQQERLVRQSWESFERAFINLRLLSRAMRFGVFLISFSLKPRVTARSALRGEKAESGNDDVLWD